MCVPVLCTQERPLTGQTSICELFVDFAVFYPIGFRWWPGLPLVARVSVGGQGGQGFRWWPWFPFVTRVSVGGQDFRLRPNVHFYLHKNSKTTTKVMGFDNIRVTT